MKRPQRYNLATKNFPKSLSVKIFLSIVASCPVNKLIGKHRKILGLPLIVANPPNG